MREEDLLRLTWVGDPQISPDGSLVACTRVTVDREADEYRTDLWLVPTSGEPRRQITFGPYDSQPRWSPDGRTLAFVRSRESGKPGQLHLLSMAGGEAVALTTLERGATAPAWSPDGRQLAFLSGTNLVLDGTNGKEKPKNEPGRVVTRPMFRMN